MKNSERNTVIHTSTKASAFSERQTEIQTLTCLLSDDCNPNIPAFNDSEESHT